jgi:histidine ammonia-lyase
MGANAATKLLKVCKNIETVLAIEYMNAAQALEYRRPLKSSNQIEEVLKEYRSLVPRLENDRYLYTDIQTTKNFISHKKLNFDMQSLISISR